MLAAEPRARAAAALGLLSQDLYTLLLPALVEVAMTGSDRLRWSGSFWLQYVCSTLHTDGSTAAVGWLYRYAHEASRGQIIEGTGHANTVLVYATSAVAHTAPYWVLTWLQAIEHGTEAERKAAITALDSVSQASNEVIGCLCAKLTDASCDAIRDAAASGLCGLRRYSAQQRSDAIVTSALVEALRDPVPRVRRAVAYALQWTEHEAAATGTALLKLAQDDPDVQARVIALLSLGRVLRRTGQLQTDDVPDNPLLRQMQELLAAPDPLIGRAAAGGIAAAVELRADSMAVLSAILPDPQEVLAAALSGAADTDFWKDEADSRHEAIAGKLAVWLYDRPAVERNRLVEWMLAELEMAAAEMEAAVEDDRIGDPPWARRRIIIAVLAELSNRLTHHSFAPTRQLEEVVALFARTALDPSSFSSRRFSLRALGNLQQFTPEVATAFFEACRDVSEVYQEPKTIIRKFKNFAPGCFRKLTAELFDPANDALLAAHAATLLGELGVSRSEELGPAGRREISAELVRFLESPLAEREVVEQAQAEGGDILGIYPMGPLYNSVYEALVRVVAGPDAPTSVAEDSVPAAETVWQRRDGSSEQLQEILHRFERDDVPAEGEAGGPKVRVIWREGHGEDYRVSVYGEQQWSQQVSHQIEGGYLQLIFQPRQVSLSSLDGVIVISRSADPATDGEPGADPRTILDEPGARLLHEIQLRSDDFIIGIPRSAVGQVSYIDHPDRKDVILRATNPAPLAPEDLVFRRSNDLNISFPHWEGVMAKASYTIEDGRLNIHVVPGAEGLKLRDTNVVFSRGTGFPAMDEADVERVRGRKGIPDMQFTASLPWENQEAGALSYHVIENCLHIIVGPAGDWSFGRDDVRFTTSAVPEEPDASSEQQDDVPAEGEVGEADDPAAARDRYAELLPVRSRELGPEHPDTLVTRSWLAYWTGEAGDRAAARNLFAELLPVEERVRGPEDPSTLNTRYQLAYWTGEAGDPAAARNLFAELLPVEERVRGPEDPSTLVTRSALARWTGEAGDRAAARDLYAELLPVRSRVLGPEHPDTLVTRSELARWTGEAGDRAAARDLYAELLPVRSRVLGPEHLPTPVTRYQLARWTGEAGDRAAARNLFAELLPVEERVRGPEDPSTLNTCYQLAYWTGEAGDRAAARDLFAELLPVRSRVLGPEHLPTLVTRYELARWTGEAGDRAAARNLFAELLPVEERVRGPEDPSTLVTRSALARWTGEAGDRAAARDLYAELLPVRSRVLGPEHSDTLVTRYQLARWTGEAGDRAAARDLYAELLPVRSRVLGPEHSDTLVTRYQLARWTGEAGDPAAARNLFAELLPVEERVRGPEDPSTLVTRYQLARWTGEAGDPAAARDLYAELLPVRSRVLGPEHLPTLVTRSALARWTGEAGDRAAARNLFAELLPVEERVRGPEDPSTLNTRYQLAYWTGEAGDRAAARNLFAELLPVEERVRGPEDPSTLNTRYQLAYWTREAGRSKVRVFWREGQGEGYRVSVYGERRWVQQVSHRVEGDYLQLVFQPRQGGLPFLDGVIVVSRGAGPGGDGEPGADPRVVLHEPGTRLLHEVQLGSDDFIIGIPRSAVGEVSYSDHPDRKDVILQAADAGPLAPEDLAFRGSNDLTVSFPYWEEGIAKVSYTLEDGRLNINLVPGPEGLKLQDADVLFSRGAGFPAMGEADVGRVRGRGGTPDMQFTVSLPLQGQQLDEVSYQVAGNCIHIIVHPAGDWSFGRDDVRFTTSAIPEEALFNVVETAHSPRLQRRGDRVRQNLDAPGAAGLCREVAQALQARGCAASTRPISRSGCGEHTPG